MCGSNPGYTCTGASSMFTTGLILSLNPSFDRVFNSTGNSALLTDLSGLGNNVVLQGNPTWVNMGPAASTSFVTFNGIGQDAYSTLPVTLDPSFTLCVWFRAPVNGAGKIIGKEGPLKSGQQQIQRNSQYEKMFFIGSDGYLYFGIYDDVGNSIKLLKSSMIVNDNTWRYAVTSYDGMTFTLYVNGVPMGNNTAAKYNKWWSWLRLASYRNDWTGLNNGYFAGDMASIQVYEIALNASQVLQNFNSGFNAFTLPLIFCPIGTFNAQVGQTMCLPCPSGTHFFCLTIALSFSMLIIVFFQLQGHTVL